MTVFFVHNENELIDPLLTLGDFVPTFSTDTIHISKNDFIVQWGEGPYSSAIQAGWVLNGSEGLQNCSDSNWKKILPMHGLSLAKEDQHFQNKYIVFVFQLNVIALYAERGDVWLSSETRTQARYQEIRLDNNKLEIRKVKKAAIRAVYSLGLDFGTVILGYSNKESYIIQVSPKLKQVAKVLERFTNMVQALKQTMSLPIDASEVMMGADPEFVLRNQNGRFTLASNYFNKKGSVGCDQIWLRSDKTKTKLPIVELRPAPSSEPKMLVRNIYYRLLAASKKINDKNIQFLAGSLPLRGYPIGGHIHFSNVNQNSYFLRALDNYLALPLFILEDAHGFQRRPKYGFIGDYREQFHGGFEYRTLPSWLVSPRITKGVIALAKLIACSYPNLRQIPFTDPLVQQAYYDGEQSEMLPIVESLWQDLEQQPLYNVHRNYLDPFKETIMKQERWDEMQDIRPRWRIPPYNQN